MPDRQFNTLAGKTAIVVGASQGIGKAIASSLVEQGCNVLAIARNGDQLERTAAEVGARPFACDVTQENSADSIVTEALRAFGRIDILIQSASYVRHGKLEESSLADFDTAYHTYLRAPWALCKAAAAELKKRQGQILFLGSSIVDAKVTIARGQYAAIQNGLKAMAHNLRCELNEDGVRVTSIFAGSTATPSQERIHASMKKPYRPELLMQPEDVAAVVCAALTLPRTAEITDLFMRPMNKH